MIRIKDKKKFAWNIFLSMFGVLVFCMLTSFVMRVFVSPPIDPRIDIETARNSIEEVIQINVLNANGITGIANKSKEFLRDRGFDVVEIGNNKSKLEQSTVYDRVGDLKSARKVAYAMGIPDSMVVSQIDSSLYLRCSVIVGKDYKMLKPFK